MPNAAYIVLVVDDSSTNRNYLHCVLEEANATLSILFVLWSKLAELFLSRHPLVSLSLSLKLTDHVAESS